MFEILLQPGFFASIPETLYSWGINPYQSLIDIILLIFTLYVLWQKPEKTEKPLTKEVSLYFSLYAITKMNFLFIFSYSSFKKEIEQLIEEWIPEPLVPNLNPQLELDSKVPMITRSVSVF